MKRPAAWKWFAGAAVSAVAVGVATQKIIDSRHDRERRPARPAVAAAKPRPHFFLPTIKSTVQGRELYFAAIKTDGSVVERTLVGDNPLRFSPAHEVPQANGARAFGDSIVAMTDGGFLTRQPVQGMESIFGLPDNGGWTRVPGATFDVSSELPTAGQSMVRMIFPDRYLFSGGTFIQRDGPLGTRARGQRFRGYYVAEHVVQYGYARRFLAALFSDGSLMSVGRNLRAQPECISPGAVISLSVATDHAALSKADGSVWMWGDLSLGQLSTPGATARSKPVQVPGLANVSQVAISQLLKVLAVAVDRDGRVWTWGAMGPKRLVQPQLVAGLQNVAYVDFELIGMALKKDGTVWAFKPESPEAPQQIFDGIKPVEDLAIAKPETSACSIPTELPSAEEIRQADIEAAQVREDTSNFISGLAALAAFALLGIAYFALEEEAAAAVEEESLLAARAVNRATAPQFEEPIPRGQDLTPTSRKYGEAFPTRALPRTANGEPLRDAEADGPYTQLGQRIGRSETYPQAREFDSQGRPIRDIDFTDHGRPQDHPNPHQHRYLPSASGGTPQRGTSESLP